MLGYQCGTNVLLILSIKCNPKKYESTNHFEKYKGIKKRDMCGNTKCQFVLKGGMRCSI